MENQENQPQPPAEGPASQGGGMNAADEKNWAIFTHLSALAGLVIPFGSVIAPLVMWLIKREQSPLVDAHGKNALNFQISVAIYGIVCFLLAFVVIGLFLGIGLLIFWIAMVIIATIKASNGELFEYPLTIKLIK